MVLSIFASLIMLAVASRPAPAHPGIGDSVFCDRFGCNVYWVNNGTGWTGALSAGVNAWPNRVTFHETSFSNATLRFQEYSEANTRTIAYYQKWDNHPDLINFNNWLMTRSDNTTRRAAGVHEVGHSLGFGHPNNRHNSGRHDYYRCNSIMWYDVGEVVACTGSSAIQEHDREDFSNASW